MKSLKELGYTVAAFVGYGIAGILLGFIVKITWNYTMPYIFHLPVISWLRGYCLYCLSGLLFWFRHEIGNAKGGKL